MKPFEYVRKAYGVPAEKGRRVVAYGKPGVITECRGHHIGINLDECKPGVTHPYHPVDGIEYLGMGTVRKASRFRARYSRFLDYRDSFPSFIEFCRWDAAPEREWNQ